MTDFDYLFIDGDDSLPLPAQGSSAWLFDDARELETDRMIPARTLRRKARRQMRLAMRRENAAAILTALPEPGETLHIVANGTFDYWHFAPRIIALLGGRVASFYGSTWTMNRDNIADLMRLYDEGAIEQISILTGLYFKRRETANYATLLDGLTDRGQRYKAAKNHTKVMLFAAPESDNYIVCEGSANFTSNPRIEQNAISNDAALYEFHRAWMEELLS